MCNDNALRHLARVLEERKTDHYSLNHLILEDTYVRSKPQEKMTSVPQSYGKIAARVVLVNTN